MSKTVDSLRVLARKKREAKALKANMQKRKQTARESGKVEGAESQAGPGVPTQLRDQ